MNARIKIDYSGTKPKIKFTFPNRREQREGSMLKYIMWFWVIVNMPTLAIINLIENKILIVILSSQIIVIPLLAYFLFKKKWNNITPDFMAFISKKKYTRFTSKDILIDDKNNYYCEVILFENILLDYVATKDFSKFLTLFEIKEHNFKYTTGKQKVNDGLWYAKFYFKQKPKTGKLEVMFK